MEAILRSLSAGESHVRVLYFYMYRGVSWLSVCMGVLDEVCG